MKFVVRCLCLSLWSLFLSPVFAASLYLVDTGPGLRQACVSGGAVSPLQELSRHLGEGGAEADDRVLDFHGRLLRAADGFAAGGPDAGDVDLVALLAVAGKERPFDRVVVIADGGAHQGEVLDLLSRASGPAPAIEVYLYRPDSGRSLRRALSEGVGGRAVGAFGCAAADGWQAYVEKVGNELEARLADALGVRRQAIRPDTDLYADLGADSLKVYETVADICDEFGVPLAPGTVGTVAALTRYLTEAQLEAGRVTGGGEEIRYRDLPRAGEVYIQKVFYATNRAAEMRERLRYTGARATGDEPVSYGVVEVAIPRNHRRGQVESPFLGLEIFNDPKAHFQVARITRTDKERFFADIRARLAGEGADWSRDLVVFVHGFNVAFDEAAKRTAQIAWDFGFTGVPLMFSWPSDARLYGYLSDREDVQWSVAHIARFLSDVLDRAPATRIHLIAHSMGSQGLIGALHRLALTRGERVERLFSNVILAAPDFDAQLFAAQIAPEVIALADRWTIYTSDKDAALKISTSVNSAYRLGLPVTPVKGVSVIDATGIEVTPWSVPEFHSYYATKQQVIEDMVDVIRGISPAQRKLLPEQRQGTPYWRFDTPG